MPAAEALAPRLSLTSNSETNRARSRLGALLEYRSHRSGREDGWSQADWRAP